MFGTRLKELRHERGLTQAQLAKELGVNQSMISFWEKEINEPTESSIRKVADFFHVTSDYLIGLEDETGAKNYFPNFSSDSKNL